MKVLNVWKKKFIISNIEMNIYLILIYYQLKVIIFLTNF